MPSLLVTATGTEAGKTFVTAGLLRAGSRAGVRMDALKPVLSGYAPEAVAQSDAAVLLEALGRRPSQEAIAAIAPWRFTAPLSPDMAAELEGRTIPFADVVAACRAAIRADALTLIEGVGGVMVPLDARHTVLDLVAALSLPVLLISGTALGAISHCLTAIAALAGRGIAPQAILLNENAASTVPLAMTQGTLERFCPCPVLVLPRHPGDTAFDSLFAALAPAYGPFRRPRTAP